jgi:hypothetical protein
VTRVYYVDLDEGGELPEAPDPAELLRQEYRRVSKALYAELEHHGRLHGCEVNFGADCDLYRLIRETWCAAYDLGLALDWLLLGVIPEDHLGRPRAEWVPEFAPGPWPDPDVAHRQFMEATRVLVEARP